MKKILIVDDSAIMRKITLATLRHLHVDIDQADNGMEALEKLSQKHFDAMVIDLNMPGMGGLDTIQFVRSQGVYRSLSIIVVSASESADDMQRALDLGVHAFILKSDLHEQLPAELAALLQLN